MSQGQLVCLAPALAAAASRRALLLGLQTRDRSSHDGGEYAACLSSGLDENGDADGEDIHIFAADVCACVDMCSVVVCGYLVWRGD